MSDEKRPTSQKQVDANRRNAQRSTGPTSEEGKARSSRNATTHNAYGDHAVFLEVGPFGQAREEVLDRRQEFVTELRCEGAVESRLGTEMWVSLEKLESSDIWSNAQAQGLILDNPTIKAKQVKLRSAEDVEVSWGGLREIAEARETGALDEWADDEGLGDWKHYAETLRTTFDPTAALPGVWDDDNTPSDEATWRSVVEAFLDHLFPDGRSASAALGGMCGAARARYQLIEQELKAVVASCVLSSEVGLERPQAHLWRRYSMAARELDRVQTRRRAAESVEAS
jgi:hypothetical protein